MRHATFLLAVLAAVGVLGGCGREPGSVEAPEFGPPVNAPGGASAGPAPAPVRPTVRTISITVRGGQVTANTPGVFEVELERSKLHLVQLQVS